VYDSYIQLHTAGSCKHTMVEHAAVDEVTKHKITHKQPK